MITASV